MQTEGTLALVTKTACKNILFCFTAVLSLRGLFFFSRGQGWGSPFLLCVLVKPTGTMCYQVTEVLLE